MEVCNFYSDFFNLERKIIMGGPELISTRCIFIIIVICWLVIGVIYSVIWKRKFSSKK